MFLPTFNIHVSLDQDTLLVDLGLCLVMGSYKTAPRIAVPKQN